MSSNVETGSYSLRKLGRLTAACIIAASSTGAISSEAHADEPDNNPSRPLQSPLGLKNTLVLPGFVVRMPDQKRNLEEEHLIDQIPHASLMGGIMREKIIADPQTIQIESQGQFNILWDKINTEPNWQAPEIDFDKTTVMFVSQGAGFKKERMIEVPYVSIINKREIEVRIRRYNPSLECNPTIQETPTAPFQLIKFQNPEKLPVRVTFEEVEDKMYSPIEAKSIVYNNSTSLPSYARSAGMSHEPLNQSCSEHN